MELSFSLSSIYNLINFLCKKIQKELSYLLKTKNRMNKINLKTVLGIISDLI